MQILVLLFPRKQTHTHSFCLLSESGVKSKGYFWPFGLFVLVCYLWLIAVHNTHAGIRINCPMQIASETMPLSEFCTLKRVNFNTGNSVRRTMCWDFLAKYDNCICSNSMKLCIRFVLFSVELFQAKLGTSLVPFYWSISIGFNSIVLQGS